MDSSPAGDPSNPSLPPGDPSSSSSDSQILASLLRRVAELERQVAAFSAAPSPGTAISQAPSGERSTPAAPPLPALRPHPAAPPPPRIPSPPAAASKPQPTQSLEDRLGSQVFNRIGIVALLFATSWALKLAIEHGWISFGGRVLCGLAVGAGLILWSERFRQKGFAAFSFSLKAVATGVLYLSLWAAFQLYHLLPASVALGAMILVTAWNAFKAWSQDAELLAAYAFTGAFATPLLLFTGGDHEVFLFTYIAAIDLATLLLVRSKPWPRLLLATLAGTILFFIGWYSRFFPSFPERQPYPPGFIPPDQPFALTVAFVLLFFVLFALPSIRGFLAWTIPSAPPSDPLALHPAPNHPASRLRFPELPSASSTLLSVLIPLGNAGFASLALYSLFQDSERHALLPWLMLAFAAAYLGLMRLQQTALSAALHLALAVVFLTIAIPLKASGHTLTIAWLVEGLVLLWASTRFPQPELPASGEATRASLLAPAAVLRLLSFGGYTLGFLALVSHLWFDVSLTRSFFNANLALALVGVAAFAGAAYLGLQAVLSAPAPSARPIAWLPVAFSDFLAIDAIALLLTGPELLAALWTPILIGFLGMPRGFKSWPQDTPFANPDFFTALLGLAILAATTYALARLARSPLLAPLGSLAAATFILFNLATILTIEREISSLWTPSDANLQRSLAISAFLMLYAAGLLTLGFFRRSAFTRWQALVLLLFTVAKVFLYDSSALSQGYRVASVLALGVVLMAVSFAYQKDWLNLRTPVSPNDPDHA